MALKKAAPISITELASLEETAYLLQPLKHGLAGLWSRRLTQQHRIAYVVKAERVEFLQARYHY